MLSYEQYLSRFSPPPPRPKLSLMREPKIWIWPIAVSAILLSATRTAPALLRLDTISGLMDELGIIHRYSLWFSFVVYSLFGTITFEVGAIYLLAEIMDKFGDDSLSDTVEIVLSIAAFVVVMLALVASNAQVIWETDVVFEATAGVGMALLAASLGELAWRETKHHLVAHFAALREWQRQMDNYSKNTRDMYRMYMESEERKAQGSVERAAESDPWGKHPRAELRRRLQDGEISLAEVFARCNTASDLWRKGFMPPGYADKTYARAWQDVLRQQQLQAQEAV